MGPSAVGEFVNDEHREGISTAPLRPAAVQIRHEVRQRHGWPSFFVPIEGAIETNDRSKIWNDADEVHCAKCKGHLGHVFEDGPARRTALCMNGVSMAFKPG